jgi:uncharacterized protein (TIGR02145 family)
MKALFNIFLLSFTAVLLIQCKKEVPIPNETWVAGARWIDTRDGHSYATVPIGKQIWMAENMAWLPFVNEVNDGSEDQGKENDPFYYVYDYNGTDAASARETSNYKTYGVLYNYNAALDACPDSWHLPTDKEWMDLESYLGMNSIDLAKQGSRGTDQGSSIKATWGWEFNSWNDIYGNGTNETGFTALPGGLREIDYSDLSARFSISHWGFWWSSTELTLDYGYAWERDLMYTNDYIYRGPSDITSALSVRCVKN